MYLNEVLIWASLIARSYQVAWNKGLFTSKIPFAVCDLAVTLMGSDFQAPTVSDMFLARVTVIIFLRLVGA